MPSTAAVRCVVRLLTALVSYPVSAVAPLEAMLYVKAFWPVRKTFWPDSEMFIDTRLGPLSDAMMSAARPPQPTAVRWSGMQVCHCLTWSACEKSETGSDLPDLYSARVIGRMSEPTFDTKLSLPWTNRSRNSGMDGCSPSVRPPRLEGVRPSNVSVASARLPR